MNGPDVCVFCGARPIRSYTGEIVTWAIPWSGYRAGPHEHELLQLDGGDQP